MSLMDKLTSLFRSQKPTIVDYQTFEELGATGTDGPDRHILSRVGPNGIMPEPSSYKLQQSYSALLETVQDLRNSLDGQARRQEELMARLGTLPHAVNALPQTSKMQSELLQVINERLALHAEQQRKISDSISSVTGSGKDYSKTLQAIREQIETGNEIDRQLVEAFNRFSIMIDRLQAANNSAVDCLRQVRDGYATSAMQMQEWVEKSRIRNTWLVNSAFAMALVSFILALLMLIHRM